MQAELQVYGLVKFPVHRFPHYWHTLFLNSVCGWGYERVLPSVLQPSFPAHQRKLSACQNKLGKHQQDRCLWKFLWDRSSPLVIMWAYTSCPKQYSYRGRGCQISALSAYKVLKTQFSWLKHEHLSPCCLHRKEFHVLYYSRAIVSLDNSRSHTLTLCLFIFCASAMWYLFLIINLLDYARQY